MQSKAARAGLGVVLVAVAVFLFVVLRDDDGGGEGEPARTAAAPQREGPGSEPKPGKPAKPAIETIVVQGGEPVGGVKELTAVSGERIRFRVRSDTEGEVHIHGYELEKPIGAGESVSFDFAASLEGGFEVELHQHGGGGDVPIAELAIQPG